jgi:hypothetical protein
MKFFNSISVLSTREKPVSMEEAVKLAAAKPKMRSLEDILASTKAIKTAAVEAPKVQVKVAEMPDFIKKKIEEKKNKGKDGDKKEEKGEKKDNPFAKKEKDEEPEEKEAAVKLKMTKSLDFREFPAEKVVAQWKQAGGDMAKCVAAVKGKTNDPQTYCGLLRVAAMTAGKVVKVAAAKNAKVAATKSPAFKKLAKLTESERTELFSYWKELYGEGYAKAMLEDY